MAVLRVATQAQLVSAVKAARSGDTIALAAGTYDGFTMNKVNFAQKVTITSADAGRPATINEFLLRGVSNVEFKNLRLDYNPAKSGDTPFWMEGSNRITLDNVDIIGQVQGKYGAGIGLRIKNSADVTLKNSDISEFRNGLYASNSRNVEIVNNDFTKMSNDGMLLGGMSGVLIAGNDLRDFNSPPQMRHKDGIQFLTSSGEPGSKNVVIRGNTIVNDEVSHGIFLTNSQYNAGKGGVFHSDVLIEDNVLHTNQVHGISVNHGNGITIRDNVVMPIKGGGNIPLINVSKYSVDVRIQNNDVTSVQKPQNGSWTVSGNDTSKSRQHWEGDPGAPKVAAGKSDGKFAAAAPAKAAGAAAAVADEPDGGGGTGGKVLDGAKSGKAELFRIGERLLDDDRPLRLEDVDFRGGDVIVFSNFDRGEFRHDPGGNSVVVWKDGSGARLDSVIDLREVVESSPGVSARTQGDQLIVEIDDADIVFAGLGGAYRAVDTDLF